MTATRDVGTPDVTIGDIVAEPALAVHSTVMPPGGMRRAVAWVHATEQLDPRPHLRRNEIVCTLGSALVRGRSAERFVEALISAEVSGLALGLGEVHLAPPEELVKACEAASLPLLLLPHGVPFLAVNDAILRRRTRLEDEARRQETVLLAQLLGSARDGCSEVELLLTAAEALGGPFCPGQSASVAPAWGGEGPGPSAMFLEQLGSILEFARLERDREVSEALQHAGQLISLIGEGLAHPAAVLPELEARGISTERMRVSIWPTGSEGSLAAHWPGALIGVAQSGVVMIAEAGDPSLLAAPGLVCGYSESGGIGELRRALSEAASALRLARSRGGIAGPESLVSLDALLEQQPPDRLAPFIEQLVAPLLEADAHGRGDLVHTLTVFVARDRQLQETADALFVHVNTVRHRLARIRELVGRDPLSPADCTDLRIALWAAERRRVVGHRLTRALS